MAQETPTGITTLARILLLLAIGFVIWLLFRNFFKAQVKDASAPGPADIEDMVACTRCGVNMPRSESVTSGSEVTCRDPASCKHAR